MPAEWRSLRDLENRLTALVAGHGYQRIETPVIEHSELFARKLGGERLAQTYQFSFRGRELALRPEHTASAMRLYVAMMQSDPLPVRLSYGGPVFRYESPQAGRSRQFFEFGCELIGADGLIADAETILLALSCVREAGVAAPRLVLGHIGVVIGFLEQLRLDHRTQDWLIWSMERIRRGEPEATEIPTHLAPDANGQRDESLPLDVLDRDAVVDLLRQSGVEFEAGSRSAEEIVDGLFDKRQRVNDRAVLEDAVGFVRELVANSGHPMQALPALRALIESRDLDSGPISELEQIVQIVIDAGFDPESIMVDLGLGRGLRYYTGMLFEIYAGSEGLQLAGGGRYDDLASQLGARRPVPSAGFSIGLERLLSSSTEPRQDADRPAVLVLSGGQPSAVFRVASELRAAGWQAVVDPRERSESAARRWASRNGFLAVARAEAGGVALYRCSDAAEVQFASTPTPGEVM